MRLVKGALSRCLPSIGLLGRHSLRAIRTNVGDLRKGDWIEHDSKILVVQSVTSAHSGRGARHFLVTTKEALTNQVVQIKPNPRDDFEKMELHDHTCQFMYENGGELVLMDNKTFEEHTVSSKLVDGNLARLLESGTQVKLRMTTDGRPIMISSMPTIKCTVAEVQEGRETSDKKKHFVVTLQGGARIPCTVQLQPGDSIVVNVDDLSYTARA